MRTFLITAITLSATLGPICPLQWTAYAAPAEEEILMTIASAGDLQACAPQASATIGSRTRKGCPTDRCIEASGEDHTAQDIALWAPITVKDASQTARTVVPVEDRSTFNVQRSTSLLAFADAILTMVKRE